METVEDPEPYRFKLWMTLETIRDIQRLLKEKKWKTAAETEPRDEGVEWPDDDEWKYLTGDEE